MANVGTTNIAVTIQVDPVSGLIKDRPILQRNLSYMKGLFNDTAAYDELMAKGDIKIYDFFDLGMPDTDADLAFGTSIVYPGKVGDEFFMTKGHFHTILDTAEVYYCLAGHGYMLMESPEGEWEAVELKPGFAVHVPGRYAHRSVNVSATEPLKTFFVFRGDAGHNYGTIEQNGFRKLVVDKGGKVEFVDNPRWTGGK